MNKSLLSPFFWLLALLLSGVTAGMFLMDLVGYYPVLPRLPDQAMIELHQQSLPLRRAAFQALIGGSMVAGLVVLFCFGDGASRRLMLASLLCLGAVVLFTNWALIPLNREIASWAPGAPPPGWRLPFSQMIERERARCLVPVVAFVLQLIAVLRASGSP